MLEGKLFAALVGFTVALYLARRVFHSHFRWRYVRETIALGMPLVPHQLMALGLVAADRFILQHYRDLREVGLYSMAYAFGNIMSLVTISLSQAWAPVYYDLARHGDEGRRVLGRMSSGLIIVLTAIACFGALIAQSFVARFLDVKYVSAGRVVPLIIGAYLAHSAFSLFSIAALQARRSQFLMLASIFALVLNTILNFALIPRLGMYGAAYATIIAYVMEALVMYVLSQQVFRLDYDLPRTFGAAGVFTVVLFVTQIRWSPTSPTNTWANLAAGLAAFGALVALGFDRVKLLRLGFSKPRLS
jgi:O-antigen/teichoic acid export membrane protein